MIERNEFLQEIQLREHIREAIKVVKARRNERKAQELKEEQQLRSIIRELISEAGPAVGTEVVHDSTGMNALEDLFKNSNILDVLRKGYKSLTTTDEQRESYLNHIMAAVMSSLDVEGSRYAVDIAEAIDVELGGDDEEDVPGIIDVETEEKSKEEKELDDFSIEGSDKTGRNKSFNDYKNIEKSIITAFDGLDNYQDRKTFKDYALVNLKMYFNRFEDELGEALPPADVKMPEGGVETGAGKEEELGLNEEINVNMDEVVDWLLSSDTKN